MSIDARPADDTSEHPVLEPIGGSPASPEHVVEVRRRPGVAAAVGAGASLVALAYLARAAGGGGVLDWVLGIGLGLVGIVNLVLLVDARVPLLVADDLGVRLRLGRTWVGLPWGGLHEIEHRPRLGWWRDGLLTVRTHYVQRVLEDLDPGARRVARANRRLHGSPLTVPIGLGTRVLGATPDLSSALRQLADARTPIVDVAEVAMPAVQEPVPVEPAPAEWVSEEAGLTEPVLGKPGFQEPGFEPAFEEAGGSELVVGDPVPDDSTHEPAARSPRWRDPRPTIARVIGQVAARFERPARRQTAEAVESAGPAYPLQEVVASQTPAPIRDARTAARAEVRHVTRADLDAVFDQDAVPDPEAASESAALSDPDGPWTPVSPEPVADPVIDPVIGPVFAAARERLGLTVDELADRTRIRPHVIEAIEIDDFGACGGDFYARGHLRTLARVLGVEGAPLLVTYDERYADAPIDPRAVFEADLAGAGSIRATRGGPNWSVLVAAVMALVLCWSVARLVTGGPGDSPDRAVLSGSGGPNHSPSVLTKPVPVVLTAAGGGARVVVRDGLGRLVFAGDLAYGQKHTVQASTPVRIQSTDGSVVVTVDGQDRGRMGPAGRPTSRSYSARH